MGEPYLTEREQMEERKEDIIHIIRKKNKEIRELLGELWEYDERAHGEMCEELMSDL
jgi:hypothetical protein